MMVTKALWKRRRSYRLKRVSYWRTKGNIPKVQKWLRLVSQANWHLAGRPRPKPVRGIDVSGHNGDVDWTKVRAAGVKFTYCKTSEGEDWVDSSWTKARVDSLRRSGVEFGPYHYLRPRAGRSGAVEARFFIKTATAAGWRKGDLLPVLDFEESALPPTETIKYLKQAVDEVKRLTGKAPIIYTGGPFWAANGGDRSNLGCEHVWLAAYVTDPAPYVPAAWKQWTIWQYTDKGKVDGVQSANCDQNSARSLPRL